MKQTWAVIACGESMSQAVADRVKHLPCVAVNNAFALAPWARALVAADFAWWKHTAGAASFAGDKWCATERPGTRRLSAALGSHTNSGLHALDVAIRVYGATRVLLLGIDLAGKHFFGDHKAPLKNPDLKRFIEMRAQFAAYAKQIRRDVEVLNCSPITTLSCFRQSTLDDALHAGMVAA